MPTSRTSRPLPVPPGTVNPLGGPYHDNIIYSVPNPYRIPLSRPPYMVLPVEDERPAVTLRRGALFTIISAGPDAITLSIALGGDCWSSEGPRYEDLPDFNQIPHQIDPAICQHVVHRPRFTKEGKAN